MRKKLYAHGNQSDKIGKKQTSAKHSGKGMGNSLSLLSTPQTLSMNVQEITALEQSSANQMIPSFNVYYLTATQLLSDNFVRMTVYAFSIAQINTSISRVTIKLIY